MVLTLLLCICNPSGALQIKRLQFVDIQYLGRVIFDMFALRTPKLAEGVPLPPLSLPYMHSVLLSLCISSTPCLISQYCSFLQLIFAQNLKGQSQSFPNSRQRAVFKEHRTRLLLSV